MVESSNTQLSLKTQCQLLSISRSGWYYDPKGESPLTLKLMRLIDEQFLATPYYGSRQMARWVWRGASPSAAVDGIDGLARDLSGTAHDPASPAPSNLSVSAQNCGDSEGESGLVHGYYLYPNQTRIFISGGDYGLA